MKGCKQNTKYSPSLYQLLRKCQPSPTVQSDFPTQSASSPSLDLERENRSSGLGCLAGQGVLSTLAGHLRKGASREEAGGLTKIEVGKELAWGAFSQALLGRLLKVTPTSNTKGFQTQRKAQPGQCQAWLGIRIQKSKSSELTDRPDHPSSSAPTPGMPRTFQRAPLPGLLSSLTPGPN